MAPSHNLDSNGGETHSVYTLQGKPQKPHSCTLHRVFHIPNLLSMLGPWSICRRIFMKPSEVSLLHSTTASKRRQRCRIHDETGLINESATIKVGVEPSSDSFAVQRTHIIATHLCSLVLCLDHTLPSQTLFLTCAMRIVPPIASAVSKKVTRLTRDGLCSASVEYGPGPGPGESLIVHFSCAGNISDLQVWHSW